MTISSHKVDNYQETSFLNSTGNVWLIAKAICELLVHTKELCHACTYNEITIRDTASGWLSDLFS